MGVETVTIDGNDIDVLSLRFGSGANRRANPQRPTGDWGSGSVSIEGYRANQREKISVSVGGVKRIDAWMQNERYDEITNISDYEIEGLLFQPARARVSVSQIDPSGNANQSAVLDLLRDAFGQSDISSSVRSTPLGTYGFEGPAGGYASRFGLVAGALPYATSLGKLGLKDPTIIPNSLDGVFGVNDYRIRDIRTSLDSEQLWNTAIVSYNDEGGVASGIVQSSNSITINSGDSPRNARAVFTLPSLPARQSYKNIRVSASYIQKLVTQTTDGTSVAIRGYGTYQRGDRNTSVITAIEGSVSASMSRTNNADGSIRIGVTSTPSWQSVTASGVSTYQPAGAAWQTSPTSVGVRSVVVRISVRYDIETSDQEMGINVSNSESVEMWGPRILEFPVWFSSVSSAAIQARIDALSKVRKIRTVDFYLNQRDATKTAEVAALDQGMFIGLPYTGTIVFVMHTEWRIDSRSSSIKRLTCIDTGQDYNPSIPTNALTYRGDPLRYRNQILTYR